MARNIEIREHVGADNIFIFGLEAHEVEERRRLGPGATALSASPMLAGVVDAIEAGIYWPGEASWFAPLMNGLRHDDHYMVAADFDAYFRGHSGASTSCGDRRPIGRGCA